MRLTHKNPIEVFADLQTVGIDKVYLGAILILLEDNQNSFRVFEHISDTGLVATTTFEQYLQKVPAQYQELSVNSLRMAPVKDLTELQLLNPNDYAIIKLIDDQSEWIFTATNTIPVGTTLVDPLGTGYWKPFSVSGLRGEPVVDTIELSAIVAKDFELRQILGDTSLVPPTKDEEYVYKLGILAADINPITDIPDDLTLGYWIKQVSEDGLRGTPVVDATELSALIARDFELRQIQKDITDPLSRDEEYVYEEGAVLADINPLTDIADDAGLGYWIKQASTDGLRGTPVKDATELTALTGRDFELRQILGDASLVPPTKDTEYVFKLGAVLADIDPLIDLPADDGSGYWLKEDTDCGFKVDYQRLTVDASNIVIPFEVKNILIFRNGILQFPDTYQIDLNKISINTIGEKAHTEFVTVETTGCCNGMRNIQKRIALESHEQECGVDLGPNPLVFVDGLLVMDDEWDRTSPSTIDFGAGNELLVKQEFSVLY